MRPVETEGDLGQHLPSVSVTLSLAAFVPIPVFADLCCMSFQVCVQVLLSAVCLQASIKPSCFHTQNRSSRHSTCLSTHFAFGVMVGVYFFITVVVYLLFEKEIALLKNNWLT